MNQEAPPVPQPGSDKDYSTQFFDLSNRLQLQSKAINAISQDVKGQATKGDTRHSEVLRNTASRDQVASLEARLQRIESALQSIQRDLEGKDYSGRFNQLHDTLRSSHLSLTENLHGHLLSGKFHHKLLEPGFIEIDTNISYSYHCLHSPHGLLHLPHYCLPSSPRRFLRRLQASSREHAQEVPLSAPSYSFLWNPGKVLSFN